MTVAVVIGGGFYGATVALHLKCVRGVDRVILFERAPDLLTRGSFANQARVHRGYHYPRSFTTAHRSIVNAPRFEQDYGAAIFSAFTTLYALARRNSQVTANQMERFCGQLGAPFAPAPAALAALFAPALIEKAWLVTERAFNAERLRAMMVARLGAARIDVRTGHEVTELLPTEDGVRVRYDDGRDRGEIAAAAVFNCTYSRLRHLTGASAAAPAQGLRHEISEMVLVEPPAELAGIGATVMDGPFFSVMPFPARSLHSLSHVRYTPHAAWEDDGAIDPYQRLADYHCESRADRMIRDAARYIPAMAHARPHTSLFEVKTVLARRDRDDARPILFEREARHGRIFSVLGGKIDNVYDVLDRLDAEALPA